MERRRVAIGFALAALATLFAAGASFAGAPDDLAAKRAALDARLVAKMEALAEWGASKKRLASRDRALAVVLAVKPDDGHARAILGYRREGEGWVKKDGWSDPKDPAPERAGIVDEFEKRFSEATLAYRDDLLALLDGAAPPPDAAVREAALRVLSKVLPDDRAVREALGDVEVDGRFVLPDTRTAIARRKVLRSIAGFARAGVKAPEEAPPDIRFAAGVKAAHVEVRAASTLAEATYVARQVEAAVAFLAAVLPRAADAEPEEPSPSQVFVFETSEQAEAFFRREPRLGETRWKEAKNLRSFWIPETTTLLLYDEKPERRALAAVRHTIDGCLSERLQGEPRGWVTEGLGQYLTFLLTGRRGISFFEVGQSDVASGGTGHVSEDRKDWLEEAGKVLERAAGPERPTLALLFTMRLTAMNADASYLAYAFAEWLFEAHSEKAMEFLRASHAADEGEGPVKAVLGTDTAAIEKLLRAWIPENR